MKSIIVLWDIFNNILRHNSRRVKNMIGNTDSIRRNTEDSSVQLAVRIPVSNVCGVYPEHGLFFLLGRTHFSKKINDINVFLV